MDVRRMFAEKTATVSLERRDAASTLPQGDVLAGEVVQPHVDAAGREVIRVVTRRPWLIESVQGMTRFEHRRKRRSSGESRRGDERPCTGNWFWTGSFAVRNEPTPCTMVYATNPRFLATSWCASAGFANLPRLRRTQSPMRKRPARACPWVSIPRNNYVRPNPAGVSAHTQWQSLCFLFRRGHQRDDTQHHDHQRSAVAGHTPDQLDLRSWNSQRYGEHPERNLGRSRLLERRNQPCRRLDDHVGWRRPI